MGKKSRSNQTIKGVRMKICMLVAVLFAVVTGHAQDTSPFGPALYEQVKKLNTDNTNGEKARKVLRATYNVPINGGALGAHGLGVFLPAKALINKSYFYTATQFVDAGVGTVAFSCEDAGNIYPATDITSFVVGTITSGTQTGTASVMTASIAAQCEVTATVGGVVPSAGKVILFIEYTVVE